MEPTGHKGRRRRGSGLIQPLCSNIRGGKFPVIGKTAMNMAVGIRDEHSDNPIRPNDEVVNIGKEAKKEFTLEAFSEQNRMDITRVIIRSGNAVDRTIVSEKPAKKDKRNRTPP